MTEAKYLKHHVIGCILSDKSQFVEQLEKLEFREIKEMLEIRYVQLEDKEFWYSLDRHISSH